MDKILILANKDTGLYKFRKELIKELLCKYQVFISLPRGEFVDELEKMGCQFIETPFNRRGVNPISDLILTLKYLKIIRNIKPLLVLTYTIKPNIYGGIACQLSKTPYITNITGIGTAVENEGILQKIVMKLYSVGLKKAKCVFFQNESNKKLFVDKELIDSAKIKTIPGSGVNLQEFEYQAYPLEKNEIKLLFVGRLMRDKGIEELLKAAKIIKKEYENVSFTIVGRCEENYTQMVNEYTDMDIVNFEGYRNDVIKYIKSSHCIVLPSYHEGISNVLLESAASGRPLLASFVPGCQETFDEGVSGYGFNAKDVDSLVSAIKKFLELPYDKMKLMGKNGREKIVKEFDRNIVIQAYMDEIVLVSIE